MGDLFRTGEAFATEIIVWVILPDHYHLLFHSDRILELIEHLGRKVWSGVVEIAMNSDRHFWATVNSVHNNPVKHGYADRWRDWPFGNAREYLESVGEDEAQRVWKDDPIGDYGKGWDD